MKTLNYNLIFQKEPDGGYTVRVPALPGCVTYGKTLEKAKAMAEDAINAYIASLNKHGEPVPSDEAIFITTLTVLPPATKRKLHA